MNSIQTLTHPTQTHNYYQLYKGYLISARFTRSWWWGVVIAPTGEELKDGVFCHADGLSSSEAAIDRARRDIDTDLAHF
jgi:hypothetical protein